MNKKNILKRSLLVCAAYVSPVFALEFDFALNGASLYTDNAVRVPEEENAISERQDNIGLAMSAAHSGQKINFDADYRVGYTSFTENSQQDQETRSGQSALQLGHSRDLFNLELEHSVQLTLQDPSDVVIRENLGERSIASAKPSINLRLSSVDTINLGGTFSGIRYDEQPERDSSREGINSQWTHLLSPAASIVVIASTEDVEFESFPLASYSVEYLMLGYSRSLRKLQYSIYVGRNKSESESGSFSGGRYNFDLTYTATSSQFGIRASKELTDSSMGNGNQLALDEDVTSDNPEGSFIEADQINLTQAEIFLSSEFLCGRCTVTAAYRIANEEYLLLDEQDNEQTVATFGVNYHTNSRNNYGLLLLNSDRIFSDLPDLDYEEMRVILSYRYSLNQNLLLRLSASKENREYINAASNGEISEHQYTFGFEYSF